MGNTGVETKHTGEEDDGHERRISAEIRKSLSRSGKGWAGLCLPVSVTHQALDGWTEVSEWRMERELRGGQCKDLGFTRWTQEPVVGPQALWAAESTEAHFAMRAAGGS